MFTTAFAQRGLIAEHGVSWLLPRLVGLPAAMDLLCSARKFRAPEALALGLVSRVIADDKLMAETRAYARLMADTVSPRSVAVMKRQVWEAEFQTLPRPRSRPTTRWSCRSRPPTSRKAWRTSSRSARRGSLGR